MNAVETVAAVAEEIWRHDLASMAYEMASPCLCSPFDADCCCPAPTEEQMAAAWQEVRIMYPPDTDRAAFLVDVVLRHLDGAA